MRTETSDPTSLSDEDLEYAIGCSVLDGDDDARARFEAERDQRHRVRERQELVDRARDRRQREDREAERDRRLTALAGCLENTLDPEYLEAIHTCAREQTHASCEAVHVIGTQRASLGNLLAAMTKQRVRFARPYDALDQIELHGGIAGKEYVRVGRRRRPPVPQPWAEDIERLRELLGPPPGEMPSLT
jgi:hypothetical protein